jgi:hypothetical protein
MRLAYHCAIDVVDTCSVVRHVRYLRREGRKGVGVRFCGEESVEIARCCTKEQVHSCGGWRSMCLGTAAKVNKKFNQGLKHGNSLDWFKQRWKSCFHIQKGGFCYSRHG